jgi:3-methylcrotonyl-CoA carboxylase beta subunit
VSVIQSAINTRSEEFKANAAAMQALIDDLQEKSALVARGGSASARA